MKGSMKRKRKGVYRLIVDIRPERIDPVTGVKTPRKQHWLTFHGSEKQAEAKLREMLGAVDRGEAVESSKITLGGWLALWYKQSVQRRLRPSTCYAYDDIITNHLVPALGHVHLQALRPTHLKAYYLAKANPEDPKKKPLSRATLDIHHAILSSALREAHDDGLVSRNVATRVSGRPKRKDRREDAKRHCWSPEEAQNFLVAADADGPQLSALFALALDTGMRKGEFLGLPWSAVNLEAGTVTVDRTLLKSGRDPVFGPTKTGKARNIDLNGETVRRLTEHRRVQAELKMRNRTTYHDLGLVFAKDGCSLGHPLQMGNFGQREFARVVKAAGIRTIKVHGLRHTSATLLLAAGEPVHVVAARLGHATPTMTLEVYAHVLPAHGQQAARTLGGLLYANG